MDLVVSVVSVIGVVSVETPMVMPVLMLVPMLAAGAASELGRLRWFWCR